LKVAVLGASGHYGLAAAADAEAFRPLTFAMAAVEEGEDMAPVGRALEAAPQAGGKPPEAFADWRKLLDDWRPAVAVVNPPFYRIGYVARECLQRGIHVFAEKPLATGWSDYLALRGLCSDASAGGSGGAGGPKLMAMLTMRYEGVFRTAQRFVAEGGIGVPVLLTAQKSYPLQGWDGSPRPAFYRKRSSYGGSIPWLGVHPIDLFQWFSGSAFAEVYAAQTLLANGDNDELESAAVMHFKLASGALATAQIDFLRRRGPGHATSVPWGDDRLRVAGDKGTLEIREGRIRVETAEGAREIEPDRSQGMFAGFLDWIEKGEPMLVSTQDCLRAAEAALRARDSADWGRVQAF
jgi:predicted dehydrogenase